jgi:hypothetical protein
MKLGTIDSSMKFTWAATAGSPMKARDFYNLMEDFSESNNSSERPRSGRWKISDPEPQPLLSVKSAIQYVAQVLRQTKDIRVKRNARVTLAILKQQIWMPVPHT